MASILAASVLLYKLTYLEIKNKRIAWLSVIFLNLYPVSYFTMSVYSESLFLLLTISSFYCLKKENYLGSGICGGGAILTRIVGVVFLPVYALYFLYNYKKSGFNIRTLYPFLASFLGLAIHLVINKIYFGSYFYLLTEKLSINSTKHLILPFQETILDLLAVFKDANFWDQSFMMIHGWNAIFTVFALVITLLGIKKINWIYTAYSLGALVLISSLAWGISNARYTLPIFPIFIILAWIKNKTLIAGSLILSTFMLFYFARIYTSGAWAF